MLLRKYVNIPNARKAHLDFRFYAATQLRVELSNCFKHMEITQS